MNITIVDGNINGASVQTVNARELHAFLESKQEFSNWIKGRIQQYDFQEGVDFVFDNSVKNSSGGRPSKDYHISLDMAKELSMVERNEKGKEARQYFIECERRAKTPNTQTAVLSGPQLMAAALIEADATMKAQSAQIEELKPKAIALDRLDTAEGSLTPRPASKVLGYPERKLTKWLEGNSWAFRQNGKGPLQAYADKRNRGYLDHKLYIYEDERTGEQKTSAQMVITPKGLSRLSKVLPQVGGVA